ncbi:MAG: site-2 protease family protein [Fibrobacterota bacterium]
MDSNLLLRIPAILIALTVHELSHGLAALRMGDTTARDAGRLTLNPLPHLSVAGTLMLLFGPIGWAKPVPVDPRAFHNPRRDMMWVALAGPGANIAAAMGTIVLFHLIAGPAQSALTGQVLQNTMHFLVFFYIINLGLALFNLLPVAPLDGYSVMTGILPRDTAVRYAHFSRYVPQIFLGLLVLEWIGVPLFSRFIIRPVFGPWFSLWNSFLPPDIAQFMNQLFSF